VNPAPTDRWTATRRLYRNAEWVGAQVLWWCVTDRAIGLFDVVAGRLIAVRLHANTRRAKPGEPTTPKQSGQ